MDNKHIDKLQSVKEILSDLISFPVIGGDSNLSIADYICKLLEKENVAFQTVYNREGTKKLIHARIGPSVNGGVILSGHTDVVPVKGQDWHSDPFLLTEKENKWYGRGTCDMKGFLACCLASIPTFTGANLIRPVYFAFSYDEEIGCLSGKQTAEAIQQFYPEKPSVAIIGEATMMHPIIGHKGISVIKTTVLGSAGHSSRILKEVSAVHVASRLIVWLEDKMQELLANGHTDDTFDPNHTSIHAGLIHGGVLANVIADRCEFHWDVRVIPRDNVYDILHDFYTYCETLKKQLRERFEGVEIINEELHPPVPPLNTPDSSSALKLVQDISGNHTAGKVSYATEAGQFSETGFEAIVCGPGDIAQAHRANEFVSVDQISKTMEMLENLSLYLEK